MALVISGRIVPLDRADPDAVFKGRVFLDDSGDVERVLAETGLDATCLEFELTESMLVEETPELMRTMDGLRALGVKLAIDDFGTGHSSLAHLKRFRIDKLKIDRTFVRDIATDPDDRAITAAIVDLARNMGITSIAEGVESEAQLEFLLERGCDEMQGYLTSRPVPAADIAAFVRRAGCGRLEAVNGG